jgi:hypothetical protein
MAKSKKKAFPKHVAGVKLSKKMRKRGASLTRFANSRLGSALIAEATVETIKSVLSNHRVRSTAAEAGRDIQRMALTAASRIGAVASAARDAAVQHNEERRTDNLAAQHDGAEKPSRAEQAKARRAAEREQSEAAH